MGPFGSRSETQEAKTWEKVSPCAPRLQRPGQLTIVGEGSQRQKVGLLESREWRSQSDRSQQGAVHVCG